MPMTEYWPPSWEVPIANGDDDWVSDIDLYIVMTDDSIAKTVSQRHAFAAMATTPALSMDMMKNAPPDGAYLLVHYTGEFGPQHVDWFYSLKQQPLDQMTEFCSLMTPILPS